VAGSVGKELISNGLLLQHWAGKLLPDITDSKETLDRIAVLVTGGGKEILFGVPKIGRGTGKEHSDACLGTLDEWGLIDQAGWLVFETTASNTGLKNGAGAFIESSIGQELSWVACRHHVIALVLASVFSILFGTTGGPDVAMFKRFQRCWPNIKKETHVRAEMIIFCNAALYI